MKALWTLFKAFTGSPRLGRTGLVQRQWDNPARVEAAVAKRTVRRQKVLHAVSRGGYRSATWSPT